jgi:anti-sigma regulatory factor (Ser/Thr protein kinase)
MSGSTGGFTPSPAGVARAAGGGAGAVQRTGRSPSASPLPSQAPVPAPPPEGDVEDLIHRWPLRDFTELGATGRSVRSARYHARQILLEWRLTGLTTDVELLVSELVTNAVTASRALPYSSTVGLWLLTDLAQVCIAVWDANPRVPVRDDPDDLAESGRGLLLVESIAARWDVSLTPRSGGKIVYAICQDSGSTEPITGRAATSREPAAQTPPRSVTGTPGGALVALLEELTARGLPPVGMNLTRLQGTLTLPGGLAVRYAHGWLGWPTGRTSRQGRPLHALHDAHDTAGAARRLVRMPGAQTVQGQTATGDVKT